mgnify:CR=1 FL=1|jgi:hypothetical protein|tara:strand:+ start:3147 stop:3890 length:744 start_codon:yes stop_codon:yes gene_type:complete
MKEQLLKAIREFPESHSFEELVVLLNTHGHYLMSFPKYSEPGYSCENSVWFADWNSEVLSEFGKLLESEDHSIEWSDEWTNCDECMGAFRVHPDGHGWKLYGAQIDGGSLCGNCIKEDPGSYLADIEGRSDYAITIDGIDPTQYGYAIVNSEQFEYGMHPGQDSSPRAILESLNARNVGGHAVFQITSSSQFSLSFSVFVPEDVLDVAREALAAGKTTADVSPYEAIEQGLKAAIEVVKVGKVPDQA